MSRLPPRAHPRNLSVQTLLHLMIATLTSLRRVLTVGATAFLASAIAQPVTTTAVPQAAAVSATWEAGPVVDGISQYTLKANGLRVLLFPDASNPKITVNVTYLVGSRHERYGETGMAHLLEHMLFKSTPKYPRLWQDMANRGFINNGSTWLDRTNYFESFTATPDNLRWAIEMEAERMVHSNILREELDTEMPVVRNEFEMGENQPQRTLYQEVFATAYLWHNYGHSTIGNRSDIENVGIENLRAFYRTYYQPDNAVLMVAGKFDRDSVLDLVAANFGKIARPNRSLPPLWTVEPTQDGEREVSVRRVGDSQLLFAAYHVPAAAHPDTAALQVLNALLTNEPSGRLYRALVHSRLAVSVDNESDASFDPSLMGFWVTLNKAQSIERAREVLLKTVESAGDTAFTEVELERVKLKMAKGYEQIQADSARFAVALSEAIAVGDWRFYFFQRDRVAKVTLADVARVAKAYYKRDNRTLGRFLPTDKPDRAIMPPSPALANLLADYRGETTMAEGEVFDPTPAHIDARSERYRLANGMKVVLLPKRTRGNTVNLSLGIGYGDAASRAGKDAVDDVASALLMRGARGLSRQQIADRLDALRASGSLGLGGGVFQTKRAYAAELITFVGQVYASATFSADELEIVRKEMITGLEEAAKDPQSVAANALARHFAPYPKNDARYVPTFAEQIAALRAVTRAEVLRYATRMRGLSSAEIAIVGDFDPAAVKAALASAFGTSRLGTPFARIIREYRPIAVRHERLQTPDKENTVYLAQLNFPLQDKAGDYPALLLANFIVGGSAGARIFQRVREKEGLSYDVFSTLSVPTYSTDAAWTFGFIANPQNAAKAEAALQDELRKILRDGLTDDEFIAQRKSMLDQRLVRRSQDATLAAQLATLADADRSFAFVDSLEARIAQLTRADVERVLRQYLKLDALSSFAAGDFAKAK